MGDVTELAKLVQLVLGCAVSCEKKQGELWWWWWWWWALLYRINILTLDIQNITGVFQISLATFGSKVSSVFRPGFSKVSDVQSWLVLILYSTLLVPCHLIDVQLDCELVSGLHGREAVHGQSALWHILIFLGTVLLLRDAPDGLVIFLHVLLFPSVCSSSIQNSTDYTVFFQACTPLCLWLQYPICVKVWQLCTLLLIHISFVLVSFGCLWIWSVSQASSLACYWLAVFAWIGRHPRCRRYWAHCCCILLSKSIILFLPILPHITQSQAYNPLNIVPFILHLWLQYGHNLGIIAFLRINPSRQLDCFLNSTVQTRSVP